MIGAPSAEVKLVGSRPLASAARGGHPKRLSKDRRLTPPTTTPAGSAGRSSRRSSGPRTRGATTPPPAAPSRPPWRRYFGAYAQDHLPLLRQPTAEGHAVRATLL